MKYYVYDGMMKSFNSQLIPWWSTTFDEEEELAVIQAIKNKNISQGDITQEFEKMISVYLGVPHVIAVTSGSASLLLSLMALGVGPGDEVIIPNRTWIATAHAVKILGADPIFVDTEVCKPIINVFAIASKINKKTKAIIPVHMNGRAVEIDAIRQIIGERKIAIIEDSAQALGSKNFKNQFLGISGDVGCFSLSVAKIISTGQGGFIVTKNQDLATKIRNMRTHGVENTIEVSSWNLPGFNFRFTDILASIGIVQMQKLTKRIKRIKEINYLYKEGLKDLNSLTMIENFENEVGPYIEIISPNREEIKKKLERNNIESRSFYPDLNTAHYFKCHDKFNNSKIFSEQGLYLPSGPALKDEQINKVLEVLHKK